LDPPKPKKTSIPCLSLPKQNAGNCTKKKELSLTAGRFFADVAGYGASGSYSMSPELSVGSELILNSLDLRENHPEKDLFYRNIALRFLQVGGFIRKKFSFSESFFAKIAGSYRILETGMTGYRSTPYGDFDFSLATKGSYLVASSSLGHQYVFSNGITLGCEWIGVSFPVSLKQTSSGEYNGSIDPELVAASQRLHKAFLKPHFQFMFLSLGRRF
jgi:hypothetical protein